MFVKVLRNKLTDEVYERISKDFFNKVRTENGQQSKSELVVIIETKDEQETFRLGFILALAGLKKTDILPRIISDDELES